MPSAWIEYLHCTMPTFHNVLITEEGNLCLVIYLSVKHSSFKLRIGWFAGFKKEGPSAAVWTGMGPNMRQNVIYGFMNKAISVLCIMLLSHYYYYNNQYYYYYNNQSVLDKNYTKYSEC